MCVRAFVHVCVFVCLSVCLSVCLCERGRETERERERETDGERERERTLIFVNLHTSVTLHTVLRCGKVIAVWCAIVQSCNPSYVYILRIYENLQEL